MPASPAAVSIERVHGRDGGGTAASPAAFGAFILLLVTVGSPASSLPAQSLPQWSPPRPVPGYAAGIKPPYLVADRNRTVHAFTSQWTGDSLAVFYNAWTLAAGWTAPVKILLSPRKDKATVLGAYLDPTNTIHVIFFGGHEQEADIYYARARVADAANVRAWTRPKLIGVSAGKLSAGSLAGDDKGNLVVVYSGYRDGNGLYEVHSTDRGDTWSTPTAAFLTGSADLWVYGIQATQDDTGPLHVVWDMYNRAGLAEAAYYARLETDHEHWGVPVVLARIEECLYKANWAAVAPYHNEVFAMYNCGSPPRRWTRRSSDRGTTWTDPTVAFPHHIGENGAPLFLVDSSNSLHVIFSNRTSDSRTHGVYHSEWTGDGWSEPDAIVSGPPGPHFDPGAVTGVVSQGNVLLLAWAQDPTMRREPISYCYATLPVPELPVVPSDSQPGLSRVLATGAIMLLLAMVLVGRKVRRPCTS